MRFPIQDLSQLEIDPQKDSETLAMMRSIYPALNDEQLSEAKDSLERYLKLAWRIAERIVRESEKPSFDSTVESSYDTHQRSKTHPHH